MLAKIFRLKKYLLLLILAVFTFFGRKVFAQDVHYSQFYATPLSLNPACTGFYTGDWRAMGIYRSQWKSISIPYVTQSLGFDHQWYIYTENFSWGINFINDKSGSINLMSNQFYLSFAYHKTLPNFHKLHFGIQAGYVMKNYSVAGQTYPEQWDIGSGLFNPGFASGEPGAFNEPAFLDLNAGVIWSKKYKKIEPQFGYAMYHINQPKSVYTTSNNTLPARHVIHTEAKINLTPKVYLTPKVLYMMMSGANDFVLGANMGYNLPANFLKLNSFWVGSYIRNLHESNKDAVYFVAGLNYNNFDFGFSYDVNISELKAATKSRGAFEISIIYTAPSSITDKKTIPCDRY